MTATPTGGNTSIGPNHLSTGEAISCRCAEFLARGIHAHPCAPVIDPQQSCTGRVVAGGRPPVWLGVSARDNGAEHVCESCEYQPNNRVRLHCVEQNDSNGCTNRSRSAKCIVFIGRVNREMPDVLVTAVCRTKTCKLICKSSVFVNGRMRLKGSSSRFVKFLNNQNAQYRAENVTESGNFAHFKKRIKNPHLCRPRRFEEPAWKIVGTSRWPFGSRYSPTEVGTGLRAASALIKAPEQVLVGSPKRCNAIEHCRGTKIIGVKLSGSKAK